MKIPNLPGKFAIKMLDFPASDLLVYRNVVTPLLHGILNQGVFEQNEWGKSHTMEFNDASSFAWYFFAFCISKSEWWLT